MAPKKEKKDGQKNEAKTQGPGITEVEKTLLELQVAEVNRQNGRLRSTVQQLEKRNDDLQKSYEKLDEDRADIIAYLKKTLNVKIEENQELKEKVRGLEETLEISTAKFKETSEELQKNFITMKDQLSSENKLLSGKLNTLDEFRAIRDDLMQKFIRQEQNFVDQEMSYKRQIYEAEKEFVIGKDKLKKEMEARLLKLAQDFQDATELRIAASTHRVIRENIAINNELDNILGSQTKLAELNEKYKESARAACIAKELAEEERDKAINKNVIQLKVIDQLTEAFQEVKKQRALFIKQTDDIELLKAEIQQLTKDNKKLSLQVLILEQNLHARISDQNKSAIEASKALKQATKLKRVLREAVAAIQSALKLDRWALEDPHRQLVDREVLLTRLLEIVTQYHETTCAESKGSVVSFGNIYEAGDLGFVPQPTKEASARTTVAMTTAESLISATTKRSLSSSGMSSPSLDSIKTIPSISLHRKSSQQEDEPSRESIPSFVTSRSDSSESIEEVKTVATSKTNTEKQLAESRLEVQKSLMADLAMSKDLLALSKSQQLKQSESKLLVKSEEQKKTIETEPEEDVHIPAEEEDKEENKEEYKEE